MQEGARRGQPAKSTIFLVKSPGLARLVCLAGLARLAGLVRLGGREPIQWGGRGRGSKQS